MDEDILELLFSEYQDEEEDIEQLLIYMEATNEH